MVVNITKSNIPTVLLANTTYNLTENITMSNGFNVQYNGGIVFNGNGKVITITNNSYFSGIFSNSVTVNNLGVESSGAIFLILILCYSYFL